MIAKNENKKNISFAITIQTFNTFKMESLYNQRTRTCTCTRTYIRHLFISNLVIHQWVFELTRSILLVKVSFFCFNNSFDKSRKSFNQFVENFWSKLVPNFMYDFQKICLIFWSSLYNLSIHFFTDKLDRIQVGRLRWPIQNLSSLHKD